MREDKGMKFQDVIVLTIREGGYVFEIYGRDLRKNDDGNYEFSVKSTTDESIFYTNELDSETSNLLKLVMESDKQDEAECEEQND